MTIPSAIVGAGNNSIAQNVIKVTFSEATADAPTLEAWDDFNLTATSHEVFGGTVGNGSLPMISAVGVTDGAPISAWKPAAVTAGGATINRLLGSTNYCNLAAALVAQDASVMFNLCWEIPYDASVPADLDAVFVIRYTYSGSAPILTWEFNDNVGGGSEGTPVWTEMTPGATGHFLKPTDAGVLAANLVMHKPPSGVADNSELWVTA